MHPGQPADVVMLVGNPCIYDSRVLKEATALSTAGYAVTIVCDSDHGRVADTERDGIRFRRVDMSLKALLRVQKERASTGHATVDRGLRRRAQSTGSSAFGAHIAGNVFGRIAITWLRHRAILHACREVVREIQPAIIHAHDLETLPAALTLATGCGARLIYDAHELEKHRVAVGPLERRYIDRVERALVRRVDGLITVGNCLARELASDYKLDRPPLVVMNTPDLMRQRSSPVSIRAAAGVVDRTPLGVYIGRLVQQRGVEQVLEALACCPGFHLACAGFGQVHVIEGLLALAARLGVADRLHIVPAVAPDEVIDYVKSADFAVIPTQASCLNYRYSMPNKLFEATFAGLPICASDLPEQRGFVLEAGNGVLMTPDDPAAIARAMQTVYVERAHYRLDAVRLAALAEKYAWPAQSARLLELYVGLRDAGQSPAMRG